MKVFLVENSRIVCERLVEMIEFDGANHVVGRAATYDDAVRGIAETMPDVGIFDIALARGNGIDALAEAKRRWPGLVAIVMSNYTSAQHARASALAGANFFLDKSNDFERIADILRRLSEKSAREDTQ